MKHIFLALVAIPLIGLLAACQPDATVADNNDQVVSNLQVQQEQIAADIAEARFKAENARKISAKLTAMLSTDD